MPVDDTTQMAIDIGQRHAREILAFRNRALELRTQALEANHATLHLRIESLKPGRACWADGTEQIDATAAVNQRNSHAVGDVQVRGGRGRAQHG